jgi:hypothetical protein
MDQRLHSDDPEAGLSILVEELEKMKAQLERTAEERDLLKSAVIHLHKAYTSVRRDYACLLINRDYQGHKREKL